jgi:hypothetical protein
MSNELKAKHQVTNDIIDMVVNHKLTTREVHEVCFAVMYHTLLSKDNIKIMKEQMGIDIFSLKGLDLIDFVHAMNKSFMIISEDASNELNDTKPTK